MMRITPLFPCCNRNRTYLKYLLFLLLTFGAEGSAFAQNHRVSLGRWEIGSVDAFGCYRQKQMRRNTHVASITTLDSANKSTEKQKSLSLPARLRLKHQAFLEELRAKLPRPFRRLATSPSKVDDGLSTEDGFSLNAKLEALAQPIIPREIWDRLTGEEMMEHPSVVDSLAEMGSWLATNDDSNEWVEWKRFGAVGVLKDGDIHVWTGKARRDGYGSEVPFIKTRSIVPMSAKEMADLLMDSSRVKTYNSWSLGRKDCWIASLDDEATGSGCQTKIVKATTQPPLGAKSMISVTLLHARPWTTDGSWLVVSRAPGGKSFLEAGDETSNKSNILLGVNLLQPAGDESCILTAVTHAYSPSVPLMLVERLGVKGAIKFVKDMRALKE